MDDVAVTSINIRPKDIILTVGDKKKIEPVIKPARATNKSVAFKSGNTNVATVDLNGEVTAVSEGSTEITVITVDGGFTVSVKINVESDGISLDENVSVTGVSLSPENLNLKEGDKEKLTATVEPEDATDATVTFNSSDNKVASVNNNGMVTAESEGSVTITVTTNDGGFEDTSEVTVETADIAVTGISVTPKSVNLKVGGSRKLNATIDPEDATDKSVSWSVDDDNVALVDSGGLVEATAEGEAVVTVTTVDGGFTDTADIVVEAIPVVDLSLLSNEHWPANYIFRKSSIYLNIEEITLATDQSARLLQTPEGFVLERIDIAVIKPAVVDLSLKFVVESGDISQFAIDAGSSMVERKETDGLQAGYYLPETWINLVNLGDKPEGEGRLVMSFIGYLIEPWR